MRRGKKIGFTHEYDEYLCRTCVFLRLVHPQYENVIATAHSMYLFFFQIAIMCNTYMFPYKFQSFRKLFSNGPKSKEKKNKKQQNG